MKKSEIVGGKDQGSSYAAGQGVGGDYGIGQGQAKDIGHDTGPGHGFGFGGGRGRNKGGSYGVGGFCICTKCGEKIPHQRGTKCTSLKCPECGHTMLREEIVQDRI